MASDNLQFVVPEATDLNDLQSKLQKVLGLSEVSSKTLEHTYYDSFDWLMYHSSHVLEQITGDGESLLLWRPLNTSSALASEKIKDSMKFVHDLPAGPLRSGLDGILEMRAFLPQARVRTRVQTFSLLDDEEKTVLRLAIEQHALLGRKGSKSRKLGVRLQVLPVKGYHKPEKKAVRILRKELGLAAAEDDLMLVALAAQSSQPGEYSSKLKLHLEPDMRADAATRAILLRLLEIIRDNEEGTKQDIDSEFLHDFRVAIRKTRSALSQIKGVFPQRVLEKYSAGFAWLGSVTGPTRDMDVYLLTFDHYRSSLPKSIQADIDPLHEFLIAHHKQEQAALAKILNSSRYRRLLDTWQATLEAPLPARSTLPNATRPVIEVADKRILRVYKRVVKEGLEFFQSLYPASRIGELIGVLKSLQSNLGDFQDYEVQAETLKLFSNQMVKEGNAPPQTLMAMGVLVEGLEARQHSTREEFAKRFGKFAEAENQDKFNKLFRLPRAKKEAK